MPPRTKTYVEKIPVFTEAASFCGRIDSHCIYAFISFPMLFVLAVQNFYSMLFSFAAIIIVLGLVNGHSHRKRIRSKFFLAWSILSYLQLLLVFQLVVVPQLKILLSENAALTTLVVAALYFAHCSRKDPGVLNPHRDEDEIKIVIEEEGVREGRCAVCLLPMLPLTSHCVICGICVLRRDHHCILLDVCIGANNHRHFILGLLTLAAGLFYGANLTLTSICQPMMFWGLFLVPQSCPGVFDGWLEAWIYVSAVYAALIAGLVSIVLSQQLLMIACYTTLYENRKCQQLNGTPKPSSLLSNCFNFWVN